MSWFERKLIRALSIILGLLCVALLLVLSMRYRVSRSEEPDPYTAEAEKAETAQSAYTSISYRCDKVLLSFALDEDGKWYWVSDPEFPLNDKTISYISKLMEHLTPQQTLDRPEDLSEYELDDPAATLTATRPDGTETVVTFGKTTTDGNSRYALQDDSDSLYIFSNTLYDTLQTPIYDMYTLPAFPELTEQNLEAVIITGPRKEEEADTEDDVKTTYLSALHPATDSQPTTWHLMNEDVTENALVQDLMRDLMALKVARCVDYKPSAGALTLCGFDRPAASMTVYYTTASGANGDFTLTFGNRSADDTGRYVQIGEDSTVFLMETALLDPLMHISVKGLT